MHQISKIYFVIKLYMFRASSVPIIRSYLQSQDVTVFQPDSARKRSHNLHETYQLPCVQQINPDDGHRRYPKHVEFYDKINFGYLMHLVGCFIRNRSIFISIPIAEIVREQGILRVRTACCNALSVRMWIGFSWIRTRSVAGSCKQ
jgi:hypothetical protein